LISNSTYSLVLNEFANTEALAKNCWLVILHASRIPPHVALMINGNYNSLTIKERELDIDLAALLKTISQKKIESLFIKIEKQPVFSEDYQLQVFQEQLKQFTAVKPGEATCLSPVKLFFQEFYAVRNDDKLLFEFIEELANNNYISDVIGLNIKNREENNIFTFSSYTAEELQNRIKEERELNFKR
jgi:hypothetical protein